MLSIRALEPPEVAELVGWAKDEGWNPGLADAEAFYAADPEGFLGAFEGNELAAGISAVAYGANFGFIGLYISKPAYRGQGYGKAVWEAGMERLRGRTIGLDGVPALQPYYQSVGFVKAHETLRMTGRPGPVSDPDAVTIAISRDLAGAFDQSCFPARRDAFLSAWLKPPRIIRAVFEEGRLRGYGVVRACCVGHKVGPLFADTVDTAHLILSALGDAVGGEVIIDVPAPQSAFLDSLRAVGMTPDFGTARMYLGPAPEIDLSRVFGLTTLELG